MGSSGFQAYNNLMCTPKNVKQYIDWLLRVGMSDISTKDENTLDSTFELCNLVERKYGKGEDGQGVTETLTELLNDLCCLVGYCPNEKAGILCEKRGHKECKEGCGTVTGYGLAVQDIYDRKEDKLTCCLKNDNCKFCKELRDQLTKFCLNRYSCMLYTLRCAQTVLTGVTFNANHQCEQNKPNKCGKLHSPQKYLDTLKKQLEKLIEKLGDCMKCTCMDNCKVMKDLTKWKAAADGAKNALQSVLKHKSLVNKLGQFMDHKDDGTTNVTTAITSEAFTLRTFVHRLGTLLTTIGRKYTSSYGVQARWPECTKRNKCVGCKGNVSCNCGSVGDPETSYDGKCCDQCEVKICLKNFGIVVSGLHTVFTKMRDCCNGTNRDKKADKDDLRIDDICTYLTSRDFYTRNLCDEDKRKVGNMLDGTIEKLEKLRKILKIQEQKKR